MPVLFSPKNGSDAVSTGATVDIPSDWSACLWMRKASTVGGQLFSIGGSFLIDCYYSGSTTDRLGLDRKTSGTTSTHQLTGADDGITYSASQWVFIAITQSGRSTPTIYTASPVQSVALGSRTVTVSAAGSGTAATASGDAAYIGNYSGASYALGGDIAWFGFHDVVLTDGEVSEAMYRGFTLRGLQIATELRDSSSLFDISGNGHALTGSGVSDTTDLGPPVNPLWLPMAHGWVPKVAGAAPPPTGNNTRRALLGVGT